MHYRVSDEELLHHARVVYQGLKVKPRLMRGASAQDLMILEALLKRYEELIKPTPKSSWKDAWDKFEQRIFNNRHPNER